jgi:hypothetical protein
MRFSLGEYFQARHALKAAWRRREPTVISSGYGAALVLPMNERLEDLALARSKQIMEDTASADEELKRGQTVSLEVALTRLGVTDVDLAEAVVDVNVPITAFVAHWAPTRDVLHARDIERLDFVDGEANIHQMKVLGTSGASFLPTAFHSSSLAKSDDVHLSVQKLDEENIRIAVFVAPHHGKRTPLGRSRESRVRKISEDLARLKVSLEENVARS